MHENAAYDNPRDAESAPDDARETKSDLTLAVRSPLRNADRHPTYILRLEPLRRIEGLKASGIGTIWSAGNIEDR